MELQVFAYYSLWFSTVVFTLLTPESVPSLSGKQFSEVVVPHSNIAIIWTPTIEWCVDPRTDTTKICVQK